MKVNEEEIQQLAARCLMHVQDIYPSKWKTILLKDYIPFIQGKMRELQTDDVYGAAVFYYNMHAPNHVKIWWLAAAKNMEMQLKSGQIV